MLNRMCVGTTVCAAMVLLAGACSSGGQRSAGTPESSSTAEATPNDGVIPTAAPADPATPAPPEPTASEEPTATEVAPSATPEATPSSAAPGGTAATVVPESDSSQEPTPEATPPDGDTVPTETETPTPTPTPQPRTFGPVALVPALGGRVLSSPLEVGAFPDTGAGERIFVADRTGTVRLYEPESGDDVGIFVLNITGQTRADDQEGLVSFAPDPDYLENGHLWAWYTPLGGPRRMRLSRFTAVGNIAPASSELVILEVEEPQPDHNGGAIRFGPDGMLYLSIGDGGLFADPSVAQDPSNLLGTVIRIDVRSAAPGEPYRIPVDNPFVGVEGFAPEIYAYGFRNPWRMAFDGATGRLLLADVGQDSAEEINVVRAGGNFGWHRVEGTSCFSVPLNCSRPGDVPPIYWYGHGGGRCSITGGVTYRGTRIPSLAGAYIFADWCSGEIWAIDPDDPGSAQLIASGVGGIVTFGLAPDGEVLIARLGEPLLTIAPAE